MYHERLNCAPADRRLILFAALLLTAPVFAQPPAPKSAPKPVKVARVTQAEVKSGQRVVGALEPLRTSTIGSAIDGRVDELLVNQGEAVKKDQPLARLRTRTLEIEQAIAEAELNLYKQRLTELQNGSLPEEIAEAEANKQSAEAAVRYAKSKLERIKSLASRKAASKDELDDAMEEADAANFTLKATEALLKRIKDGPRPETIAAAKAQVELQQERLNLVTDRIGKATMVSPFDGYVAAEFTEVGSWITRGDPVVEVIQLNQIRVVAPVTAEAAVNLRIGDTVRVEFLELPNELISGTINHIVPVATSRARTYPVHIGLDNRLKDDGTPLLLAGMLARVAMPAGKRETLPLVPKDALVLNGRDRAVFVIDMDASNGSTGVARKVPVVLGVAAGNRIQIQGDLKVNDRVVVYGNERLQPGAKVKIIDEVDDSAEQQTTAQGAPLR